MQQAGDDIARAINDVLNEGWRTGDIADETTDKAKIVSTTQMGDLIVEKITA